MAMRVYLVLACAVLITCPKSYAVQTFDEVDNSGNPLACSMPRMMRSITDTLNRGADTPRFLTPIPESTKGHRTPKGVECTTDFQLVSKPGPERRLTYSLSLDQGKLKVEFLKLDGNPGSGQSGRDGTAAGGSDDTERNASLPPQGFLTSSFFVGERPTSPTEIGAPMQVFLRHFPNGTWERGDGPTWIYRMRKIDKLSGQKESLDALFLDMGSHQVLLERILDNGQEADIRLLSIMFVQFRAEGQGETQGR